MTEEIPRGEAALPEPDLVTYEQKLSADEQAVLQAWRDEAASLPAEERTGIEEQITSFLAELALSELVQRQADEHIRRAKKLAGGDRDNTPEAEAQRSIQLEGSKIGWLSTETPFTVALESKSAGGSEYLFGSIVDMNRRTEDARNKLQAQGEEDYLMQLLESQSIPRFLSDLQTGSGKLRPVNAVPAKRGKVKDRDVNTTYAAYKLDVQGTRNRAVVLVPGKVEEQQVVILAAIYDHEDQGKVLSVLTK